MHSWISRVVRALICLTVSAPVFSAAGELYVGADYHPHDSDPQTWARDIALMQQGGFRVVRLGHLAWDSYEPRDGQFDFAWFDDVMDRMHAAGIKVILDLAVRPAPLWLHRLHPSIDVVDVNGVRQYPNHRYMEDVGDPYFQQYAVRFAETLVRRYGKHPALAAFGIDNEPGDGPISYSATVRARFIAWLQHKYGTVDNLNRAWAGQRWSRRIGDFEEVGLPMSSSVKGQPERVLDFRRFVSDEVNGYLVKLLDVVHRDAPAALTTTNMWYYSPKKYFDYAPIAYSGAMTRGGCGFYPGVSLRHNEGIYDALFGIARIQYENTTPFWCTEFVSATATPGAMRKAAYASLLLGNQLVCVWTWQSMHAGEEQFLEGLVDWDGHPNRKYDEYKQVAAEFQRIAPYGFPYQPRAEVALAFSFPSQIASASFPESHEGQVGAVFTALLRRNLDARVVDLTRSQLAYKVLFVPGMAIMDEPSAAAIRAFVQRGGTVVMTSYSAYLDEHHQVFRTTLPGRLNDVFGIRVASFEETESMNERSRDGTTGQRLRIAYDGRDFNCESPRFDVIEPKGAEILGRIVSLERDYPVVTSHRFGAGTAIYVGIPARDALIEPMIADLIAQRGLNTGPAAPAGVMARQIDATHRLYLNLDGTPKKIDLPGAAHSVLRNVDYRDDFELPPFEPDFIEQK
jgi:beta-galactosidase